MLASSALLTAIWPPSGGERLSPRRGHGGLADFGFAHFRSDGGFIANSRASPAFPQCERNFVPITMLLHMRGIGLGQGSMQAIFSAVIINPLPNLALSAFRPGDVDGAAMAVAAGTAD